MQFEELRHNKQVIHRAVRDDEEEEPATGSEVSFDEENPDALILVDHGKGFELKPRRVHWQYLELLGKKEEEEEDAMENEENDQME